MKLSALIAPLIEAKADHDTIMRVVLAFEAEQGDALERRRANDRDRQKRHRNVTSRDVTVTVSSHERVMRGEDNLLTKNQAGQEERKKEGAPAALSPCSELEIVLDSERARAVVDHRLRLRKPLTAHAARLLAKKLALFPDPNEAADRMIEKGWQSIEVDWDKPRSTAPPVKPLSFGQMFQQDAQDMGIIPNDKPASPSDRRVEAGNGDREVGGPGVTRRFAVSANLLGRLG